MTKHGTITSFLEENGRQEDWIYLLRPGVTAEMPLGGGQHFFLAGSYVAHIERFARFDSENHTDQEYRLGGDFNFVPFNISLQDTYKKTVDRANTEFTNRVSRNENAFHALLEIPFASFFLESELVDYDLEFSLPENSEFDRHDINLFQRVGVDVAPSTQLLGEYGYTNLDYKGSSFDRDGDANSGLVGLRGFMTERVTYQIWTGFQARIYDEDARPDYNGVVARGALQYDISSDSNITIRGDRRPEESTFDDQSFYVRNRLEVEWKQQIAERFFLTTKEMVQYNEYSRTSLRGGDSGTRRDYVWQAGIGLEYFMPNELISFLLSYNFRSRDSNTANLDYDAQNVNFGVKSLF